MTNIKEVTDLELVEYALDEACGERMPRCYKGPLDGRPHPRGHSLLYTTPEGFPAYYRYVAMMSDSGDEVCRIEYWQYVGHIYIRNHEIDMPPKDYWQLVTKKELTSSLASVWQYAKEAATT